MPQGFPDWLVPILAVVLPWAYQWLLKNAAGPIKFLVTWGTSGALAFAIAVFVFKVHNIGDIIAHILWIWAAMQFVYSLWVKPYGYKVIPALFPAKKPLITH
jgi:hypothetical protein